MNEGAFYTPLFHFTGKEKNMSEKEVKDTITEIVEDNSRKDYTAASKQTQKVQSGAKERKKSLGKRFAETFLSEDIDDVGEWVKHDVIIPGVKNLVYDALTNALQGVLWNGGSSGPRYDRRDDRRYQRDYSSYSKNKSRDTRSSSDSYNRDRFDFRDIVFVPEYEKGQTLKDARTAAEAVLFELNYLIDEYGHATVADYYNQIPGVRTVFTDNDWGWVDLRDARVKPVREGYIITLPKPIFKPNER